MHRYAALLSLLLLPAIAFGQNYKMEPGPKSPEESLKCIQVRPGFKVELMAAEPLVQDPIAFAWGPDGKFWVVEMGDYPLGVGKGKGGGRIKYLEKSKTDGPYDRMTVFMGDLGFPTGVFPYLQGVIVTCAPHIFYAESRGGKVEKEILFTGFREGNQQHRVNGLTWGIDNWIYGANGDSGGVIEAGKAMGLLTRKVREGTIDIRGRDFRFKVETGEFEAQSGQSQFGRCRDDWGNWFGNNNSNPMFHFVLDDHYLRRNPHVLYPDVRVPVPVKPGAAEVFPISKPLPRFNSPQALNHFTSACSTIIYRDTLFGPEFEGNMFVSEPVHNLVHREIMKPKGVTFTSQRAPDEQKSEFLASSDNWFRPAMIQTGPDGALWIADMYRYVIEHPEWIPKDWQKKLDLRAGHDKGRIYRVYPANKKPREVPRLDNLKISELVKQVESPNGWTRDSAHQMLVTRSFPQTELAELGKATREMAMTSKIPTSRLHAISIFHARDRWKGSSLEVLVRDPHPGVRKHVLAVWGESPFVEDLGQGVLSRTEMTLVDTLMKDPDPQVRQQLAYTLGTTRTLEPRLVRLLAENAEDRYILAAGLSSITEKNGKEVIAALLKEDKTPPAVLAPMLRVAKAYGEPPDLAKLLARLLSLQSDQPISQQMGQLAEMLDTLDKTGTTLGQLVATAGPDKVEPTLERLRKIHGSAVKTASDPKAPMSEKLLALRLLGRGLGNDRDDHKLMVGMLTPQTPDDVQATVIQQLSRKLDPRVPGLLLAPWKTYSPALRGQVLDTLFSRPLWTRLTLDALQAKQIPAQEIDAVRRQRLLYHREEAIRLAALKVFSAPSNPNRGKVIDDYWLRLPDKGDKERGAKLFMKSCATCHQFNGVGQQVGPELASVGDKSVQGLLTAILDPNRALESRYINYMASTKTGQTFSGIIAGETSTTITLISSDGKKHQLLRNELDDLSSTGKSLMPEGMEKDLSPDDLADIIEYVRANQAVVKRKELPGNMPEKVKPDKEGDLHLLPKNAAIYGPKIVIEKQYGNLGWWMSKEDHVIWTVEVPKDEMYTVWIECACANDSAGNTLAIRRGDSRLLYKVEGTGSWDEYRSRKIGEIQLVAGTQEIVLRAEGTLRNALFDLKSVKLVPR